MKLRILGTWVASVLLMGWIVMAPPANFGIAINEVAWSGSAWDPTAEWIELVNTTDEPVDLNGWLLVSSDDSPTILLHGILQPIEKASPGSGYFLLERGSDESVPGIPADQIYAGALTDRGEILLLIDPLGTIIDSANLSFDESRENPGWPAGHGQHGSSPFCSMERDDATQPDTPENWVDCAPPLEEASTAEHPVFGTPKRENTRYNVLPIADLEISPEFPKPGEPVFLDAGASSDENNEIVLYVWTFGDGTGSTGQTASHTYQESGSYPLSLVVTDEKGGRAEIIKNLAVNTSTPPLADFSILTSSARPSTVWITLDPLIFQDESSDADGPIVSWAWDFGDGTTSEEERPTHAYEKPGVYDVTLVVHDQHKDRGELTQRIRVANQPPVAQFTVDPVSPNETVPATLDASESFDRDGEIVAYHWDLDADGLVDRVEPVPVLVHVFESGGEARVVLAVFDDSEEQSLPITKDLVVNKSPVAQFQVSAFEPDELEEVSFTDQAHDSDGSIVAWQWSFGDGSTSSDASPTHTYSENGAYTVTLRVTDDAGLSAETSAQIVVQNLPPIAVLEASTSEADTGSPVTFTATDSRDLSPAGTIVTYRWDFDQNGTFEIDSTFGTISHPFVENGSYDVRVQVVDNNGATATSEPVRVLVRNRPPRATSISWSPTELTDSNEALFTVNATDDDGTITSWEWDFGDGATTVSETPSHRFLAPGTFTVRVAVTDNDRAVSNTISVDVPVLNSAPVADFTFSSAEDGSIFFDASASHDPSPDGRIVHVAWDLGDGSTCPDKTSTCNRTDRWTLTHSYSESGTYTVILVVIDDMGAIAQAVQTLTIP